MAQTRTLSMPQELYEEVEKMADEAGVTFNRAGNEGLILWLKQIKKKLHKSEVA